MQGVFNRYKVWNDNYMLFVTDANGQNIFSQSWQAIRDKNAVTEELLKAGVSKSDAQKIAQELLWQATMLGSFSSAQTWINASREVSGGHILHSLVADALAKVFRFISNSGELYIYERGIYVSADKIVGKIVEDAVEKSEKVTRHFVEEVIGHLQRKFLVDSKAVNPKHLLPLQNGLLDLTTFELKEFTPDIYFTFKLPLWYDPEADCPLFKKFLSEVLYPEDIPTMQELFGYCLWRDYHIQKAFMLVGEGSNGKSTLIGVLKAFLGAENTASIAIQTLEHDRFAVSTLYNKLANLYADLPDKALYSTGTFKMLTGGDPISADKKFRERFTFVNYAKLIFSANKLPQVFDNTDAFFRRWVIITFPNVFTEDKADKHLLEKLTTEEELSGILNWALEGLKRLLAQGHFSNTKSTEVLRDEYIRMSNPLQAFVNEYIKEDSLGWIAKDEFYARYVEFCQQNKFVIKAKNIVAKDLQSCLSIQISVERREINGERVQGWRGIAWKEKGEGEEAEAETEGEAELKVDVAKIGAEEEEPGVQVTLLEVSEELDKEKEKEEGEKETSEKETITTDEQPINENVSTTEATGKAEATQIVALPETQATQIPPQTTEQSELTTEQNNEENTSVKDVKDVNLHRIISFNYNIPIHNYYVDKMNKQKKRYLNLVMFDNLDKDFIKGQILELVRYHGSLDFSSFSESQLEQVKPLINELVASGELVEREPNVFVLGKAGGE